MMQDEQTKFGTHIVHGVEYNEPAPNELWKVMKRCYAQALVERGELLFRDPIYYGEIEGETLQDKNECEGLVIVDGYKFETSSMNNVFLSCMSFPEISSDTITRIAKERNYDCKIICTHPTKFFERISLHIKNIGKEFNLQCGRIHYVREENITEQALRSLQFNSNVFQKNKRFSDEYEYRLCLTDCSLQPSERKELKLFIGDCSDILNISALP